jgi:hypothetical protein
MAEGGIPAARRSILLVLLLLVQFFWPRLVVWLVLFALYLWDVVGVLTAGHIANDYGGLVLYGIPCAALLWALPPLFRKGSGSTDRLSPKGTPDEGGRREPMERLVKEYETKR